MATKTPEKKVLPPATPVQADTPAVVEKKPSRVWNWIRHGGPLIPIDYDKEKNYSWPRRVSNMLFRRIPLMLAIAGGLAVGAQGIPTSVASPNLPKAENTNPWANNVTVYASSPQKYPSYSWGQFMPKGMHASWFTSQLIGKIHDSGNRSLDDAFNQMKDGYGPPYTFYKSLHPVKTLDGPSNCWNKDEASPSVKAGRVALLIKGGRERGISNISETALEQNVKQFGAALKSEFELNDTQMVNLDQPSVEKLAATLQQIAAKNPSEVLIYITGEGYCFEPGKPANKPAREGEYEGHVLLSETKELDKTGFKQLIQDTINQSPAKKQATVSIVIDACNSGAFVE